MTFRLSENFVRSVPIPILDGCTFLNLLRYAPLDASRTTLPEGGSYVICCMACFDTSGIFGNETPEPVFRACVAIYLFWHLLVRLGHFYPTGFFPKSFPYCKSESNRMNILYLVSSSSLESTWRFRKGQARLPTFELGSTSTLAATGSNTSPQSRHLLPNNTVSCFSIPTFNFESRHSLLRDRTP
jgi:hypothetical protein